MQPKTIFREATVADAEAIGRIVIAERDERRHPPLSKARIGAFGGFAPASP
jgi:hypothetical protein